MTSPPTHSVLPRVALLLGCCLLAVFVGFIWFTPEQCALLVGATGYWWALAVVGGTFGALGWCVRETGWPAFWQKIWPGRGHAGFVLLAALLVIGMDRPGYKILFDEPMLDATAFTMHYERQFGTVTRAFPLPGLFTVLRTSLDKRPPVYPFLVASLHDVSGRRSANAIIVNEAGTVILFWIVWLLARRYGGSPAAGSVGVALLATFPELGVCATSAGMDLINLVALGALWLGLLGYLDRPGPARASLLVGLTLLATYCRYESVLYVGAAGLTWFVIARKKSTWRPDAVWLLLPIGLLLYAWHFQVLEHSVNLWELRPDQNQRFSLAYATNNLSHAATFLFTPGWRLPNSVLLSVGGIAGGIWLLWRLGRRKATIEDAALAALAAMGTCLLTGFALIMCYYWGELDDPLVTRLALPLHLLFTLLAVAGWREVISGQFSRGWRGPACLVGTVALALTVPTVALARYSAGYPLRRSIEWEQRVVAAQATAPDLILSNRSPVVWLADGRPALSIDRARLRETELRWHLQHHTFNFVLVIQRLFPAPTNRGWEVDVADRTPSNWRLEEIASRRIDATLTRISRLVEVSAPPDSRPASTGP